MEGCYALHVAQEARNFKATVLGYPVLEGCGPTREKAISEAERALHRAVANGEIVSVTVGSPDPNPWLRDAGMWRDMPEEDWAAYQDAIADYRRELAEDDELV